MRITLLNQKGGVGKTTLVLLLSGILKKAEYDVAIDDRDPQGSASFFAERFGVPLLNGRKPADYILTEDRHLLKMQTYQETVILNRDMLALRLDQNN